jgi:hypothetical protein
LVEGNFMFQQISDTVAKLRLIIHREAKTAVPDPVAEKMRDLKWAATEDDRSALRSQAEDELRSRAPLAETMATSYMGRTREPFE